jgi:hypothetical protein
MSIAAILFIVFPFSLIRDSDRNNPRVKIVAFDRRRAKKFHELGAWPLGADSGGHDPVHKLIKLQLGLIGL